MRAAAQGLTFRDLFLAFVREGAVPIALYRCDDALKGRPGTFVGLSDTAPLPYVYTSPAPTTVLHKRDQVFVLLQPALQGRAAAAAVEPVATRSARRKWRKRERRERERLAGRSGDDSSDHSDDSSGFSDDANESDIEAD